MLVFDKEILKMNPSCSRTTVRFDDGKAKRFEDRCQGFSLIELLTVIAIIAILASFTAVVLPRVLEKAKVTHAENTMINIGLALKTYYTEHSTYPPGYGFIEFSRRDDDPNVIGDNAFYHLNPYTSYIGLFGNADVLDIKFSGSYDADGDNIINMMEYSPIGIKPSSVDPVAFPTTRYTSNDGNPSDSALRNEVNAQLSANAGRPFIYIPVNINQFKAAQKYWIRNNLFYGENWDSTNRELRNVFFPPARYDAYVLMSPGPGGQTYGLLDGGAGPGGRLGNEAPEEIFHVRALHAYFLATRDLNDNKVLDFAFRTRTQAGEGKATYEVNGQPVNNQLPDLENREGAGPLIHFSK